MSKVQWYVVKSSQVFYLETKSPPCKALSHQVSKISGPVTWIIFIDMVFDMLGKVYLKRHKQFVS